jgi:hypothetical protein
MEEDELDFAVDDAFVAPKGKTTALGKKLMPAGTTGRSLAPPGGVKKRSGGGGGGGGGDGGGGGSSKRDKGDAAARGSNGAYRHDLSSQKTREHRELANGGASSEEYQSYFAFSESTRARLEGDLRAVFEQLDLAQQFADSDGVANGGGGGFDFAGMEELPDLAGDVGDDDEEGEADGDGDGGQREFSRALVTQLEERHEHLEAQLTGVWDEFLRKDAACRRATEALEESHAELQQTEIESSTSLALAARQLGE